MCGGGGNPVQNVVQSLDQANAGFHPLKGIIDQPVIDPILQGDMTVKGDVVPGSYVDKKNQNLGVSDMQQTAGFFSKAIAGGLGGNAAAGALGDGAVLGGESGAETLGGAGEGLGGGGGGDPSMFGPEAADTLDQSLIGPNSGAQPGSDSSFAQPTDLSTTGPSDPNRDPSAAGTEQAGFLDGTTPIASLDPSTASALGISSPTFEGADAALGNPMSFTEGGGSGIPGTDYSIFTGETPTDMVNPVPDETLTPADVTGTQQPGALDKVSAALKKVGLTPTTASLLGISGLQALSKPKTPAASSELGGQATANSRQASAVIQSGGQSSPAWQSQKASIDATIDQQIEQQVAAMKQQAINSGQGADSQVTLQQINKLKTQLETQRQNLYAQAQGQNVAQALQALGISDQALSGVAAQQYKASQDARTSAANTAQMALMLQALSSRGGGSAGILPRAGQEGAPTG